ncbi:AraC family transcriptional regulator [Paenibacillus sp. OV219]|uniref:helix-turn-helix transcriptional regulator n=1 Tax=Paenibacillus sp. OV219 TaxID=1884377 RepID=UPI0008C500C1|nr:AraC family transcriptional regulator [Paenibacillus sp. OV219]SEO89193.1 AraC-type DNA-binding protein [Paenibacillus sp. OV219]
MQPMYPFVRFGIRVPIRPEDRHPARFCFVPSLYFIESGCAKVIYEDGTIVRLKTGTLFFLQPGIMHVWEVEGPNPFAFRCVFFEWSYRSKSGATIPGDLLCHHPEDYDNSMLDEPIDMGIPERLSVESIPFWKGLFEAVSTEFRVYNHEDYPDMLAINGYFHLLLHQVYQLIQRQNDYMDPRIAKLKTLMEQQAGEENGDIDHWAATLGLSRSHFHSLFRAQIGFTPTRYWNRCRINKAQADLRGTTDSVTMIAQKYGFSSVHAFIKVFRQLTGVAPTIYRQQSRLT